MSDIYYNNMKCDDCKVEKAYPTIGKDLGYTGMGQGDKQYTCICEKCGLQIKANWDTYCGRLVFSYEKEF